MPLSLPSNLYRPPPLLIVLFLSMLLISFSFSFHRPRSSQTTPHRPHSRSNRPSPRTLFLSLSPTSNSSISSHLRSLTRGPHLAGTLPSATAASYVLSHFRLAGLETLTKDYTPLLSYPSSSSLSLLHPNRTLIGPLPLSEPADLAGEFVAPYHAYSPSGSVIAPAVYVNYGNDQDYSVLGDLGVAVGGCVAIVRRGEAPRGAVIEKAAERGAKAVLMFSEKADGGVERGMVLLGGPGDPLTPGWAAAGGGERLGTDDADVRRRFPRIPSIPVSLSTGREVLRRMGGPSVPEEWRGEAVGEWGGGVGGGTGGLIVNFTYQEDRKLATIQNVFGIIKGGEEPDRYVILGNHRDAWTYGAVDPNSGTAALLDIAHRYGVLLRSGWRPRRTIVLCSWDAEEFGMIGSTEWVEQNLGILGPNAVAYLNVDCAVQGSGFFAGATPQLDKLLIEVTKQIKDPDLEGLTVYQTWVAANGGITIERLARANSDFSAFLHHAGVPSVDLYYGEEFPGYHTALDAFDWMEKHGDPLFHRHVAISEIWGVLGLQLADDPVLPFDYLAYATQLQNHANELTALLDNGESLQPMIASIGEFMAAANESVNEIKKLEEQEATENFPELRQRTFNDRLMLAERGFLEAEGLTGRQWFKHLVYAPPEDYESKLSFFPGIADAISRAKKLGTAEAEMLIGHEIWRVARAIQRAAGALRGQLT